LKLKWDVPLSNIALKSNLRHYNLAEFNLNDTVDAKTFCAIYTYLAGPGVGGAHSRQSPVPGAYDQRILCVKHAS
jgi:hypothetical protein